MTTFLAIAENSKLEFSHFESKGVGNVDKVDGKYLVTEITLRTKVIIARAEDVDKTKRILEKSEKACIISESIKTIVHLEPEIVVSRLSAHKLSLNKGLPVC